VFWAEKEAANKLLPPNDSCRGTIATTSMPQNNLSRPSREIKFCVATESQ